MMNTITFKAVRTVYMENGKSRKTVKTYETYEQAKAYAKRYSKITASKATSRQKFINVSVYINTDDYKYQNVDIYTIDSNEFEIEHLEQIEKFQRDVEEMVEPPQKTEKKYNKGKQVDVIPAYSAKQHTHYELEINEYDETGYITNENTVKFKTLEEATAYVDKLIKNAGENEIVLRLYKVTGEDFECLFTKRASKIHGTIGILEDKPGQTVAEVKPEPEPTPKIKTLQDWEKKGGNFTDFCKVGDKVDKGIVDYFVDVLPPITWRTDLVQCGEPYGHRDNPETGRWEATFITFSKNDKGQWYYAGICFLNQREAKEHRMA